MHIIYIISQRRSGSTLIENLLGQHPNVVSVGEYRLLKDHFHRRGPGKLWKWKCNCGEDIVNCKFWSKYYVVDRQHPEGKDTALTYRVSLLERIGLYFGKTSSIFKKNQNTAAVVASDTMDVFKQITKEETAEVIIDSSKDALQGYYLAKSSDSVTVVYLKRQLRATVASKYKRSIANGKSVKLLSVLFGSFLNEVLNGHIVDELPKSQKIILNYEKFVQNTDKYYLQILEKVNLPVINIPKFFQPYPSHSIAGTPGRFEKKEVVYDDSWKLFYKSHPISNFSGWLLEKLIP